MMCSCLVFIINTLHLLLRCWFVVCGALLLVYLKSVLCVVWFVWGGIGVTVYLGYFVDLFLCRLL